MGTLPQFDDEEVALIAGFAYPIAWAGVFTTLLLFAIYAFFNPPGRLFRLQFVIPMFFISVVAVWLVRHGWIRRAAQVIIVIAWAGLVASMIQQGGVRSPSFGFYSLTALAPFIIGWRAGTILAVMTFIAGDILLLVEVHTDWLPPVIKESSTSWWMMYSIGLLFMAIPVDIMARNIQRAWREKRESEQRHRALFQDSPIALWEEDFSAIKQFLDELRARGTTDVRAHFYEHPADLAHCASLIKVLDVNQAALDMYGATTKDELVARLRPTFDELGYETFRDELIALSAGETAFVGEADLTYTLTNEPRYTTLRLSIAPGHEARWDRVLVSVVDLTDQMKTQEELQTLYNFQSLITNLAMDFINMTPDELDQGINEVLQRVTEFIEADAGVVFRLSEGNPVGGPVAAISNRWIRPDYRSPRGTLNQVRGADYPWVREQLLHFEVVNIRCVDELPPDGSVLRSTMEKNGMRSLILVPLTMYQDQLRGFLGLCTFETEKQWSPDIIALLKVVAEIVMNAMEHQRSEGRRVDLAVERERVELMRLMIGNLSHDLKAPLSVIKANLYLAQNLPDPARRQAKLDAILEQTERIDTLVTDLMTLTRLESTVPTLNLEPLNMGLLLEDIAAQLKPLSQVKRLHLTVDAVSDLPPVMGDRNELSRVFVNLVQNAINYTPEDRSIVIRIGRRNDHIVTEVEDKGIGIPETDLALVFERFYRSDQARAMIVTGTGLGLPIVKRIVEMHDGVVGVRSVPGEGSTFWVELPIWKGRFG